MDTVNFKPEELTTFELYFLADYHHSRYWLLGDPEISDEKYDFLTSTLSARGDYNDVTGLVNGGNNNTSAPISSCLESAYTDYMPTSKELLTIPAPEELTGDNRFFQKTVLFTGFYPEEKEMLEPVIQVLQLTVKTCVSRKLDFLICGSNAGPSKQAKAKELNIEAVDVENFFREITGA